MRAPSKRVTFVIAFLVANFLLFFPFASEAHQGSPAPAEGGGDPLEEPDADPGPGGPTLPEDPDPEPLPTEAGDRGAR